jgi:N-methylhydantoinase B
MTPTPPPPHPALSPGGGEGIARGGSPRVDPITLEIIRGSLASTIRDMELLMERCAMSPFIKEKKDYFVGVFDTQGRIVACHISGSGPGMLTPILKVYQLESMRPGDVYWYNDPYISDGAVQHHQDMVFTAPIFHEGRLVGFATTFGHYQDIGGLRAGSISPHATEIYHEGLLVPPVRIVREGQLNEEAYRIFLRNSRLPDLVEGDTRAMMASCRLADTRLTELCARYGANTVLAAFDECIAQTATRARELFLQMVPEGRWSFHDFLDSDGGAEQRPFRVELELSRTGDHVRLDGSRSDDQARGPINYTTNAGLLRIAFGRYLQSLDADLDVNEGLLRNLDEWIAREGSILKPRFPAPLGMRANTRFRVMSCIFGSLAQANGGSVPAGSPVYVLYYFRSWDEVRRRPILCIEGLGVGLGARPFADGVDVIYYIAQENYPVEYVERDFPLRIERYAARPDSGGPGLHRGGCGVVRDVRVLAEKAELATRMENTVVAPYGVAGGRAGRTGRIILNPGTPEERELVALGDGIVLKRGDLLRFETCGGGGWGDPLERDPERVRTDVARGFITARGAFEDYGVTLDPATLDLDKTATDEERRRRARDLPLIDRGPGFEEAEARWRTFNPSHPSPPKGERAG